jgi:hypothetical protein
MIAFVSCTTRGEILQACYKLGLINNSSAGAVPPTICPRAFQKIGHEIGEEIGTRRI